jgi:Asp/Glu/hydantoin racemase
VPATIPDVIANREAHLGAIVDAIRACSGDAVLLGGAPLAGLGTKMTEETGVTVLDGVEASVAAAMRMLGSGV